MVQHCFFLLFSFLISLPGFTQDERYYRQILTGELPKLNDDHRESFVPQFNVKGSTYKYDLNGDGVEESIEPQKRDGVDWLEIRDTSERKLFEGKLLAMGAGSSIYKIRLVSISPKVRAAILFLDEGATQGKRIESTARIFVLSFEDNDLNRITLTQGPHIFHEKEARRDQYFRKDYTVNVYDIDGDGTREIAVMYNHIQRIMRYKGKGIWERI